MSDTIPYGPDQLPWKDTVADIAKTKDGGYLISPPSRDPNDVYDFPEAEKGITPVYYQIPSKGMTADQTPSTSRRNPRLFNYSDTELPRISSDTQSRLFRCF